MELRHDSLLSRSVIIAPGRADRPHAFVEPTLSEPDADCPFCPGREDCTPHELLAFRSADSQPDRPGWRVRVVPNKYPALLGDIAPTSESFSGLGDAAIAAAWQQPAFGAHEVVIETPRHVESLTELDQGEIAEVLTAYQQRLLALQTDRRLQYAIVFKNVGRSAGASLAHTHSQIMALAAAPPAVLGELDRARSYYQSHGRCAFCDLLEREIATGGRIVELWDELVVFCPYASRLPLEMCILPRRHAARFEANSAEGLAQLAHVLRSALVRLERVLGRVAYNYIIATSPFDMLSNGHYHWRIEVLPRLTTTAGFEWGSGCYINPVPPEQAAAMLRSGQLAAKWQQ